MIGLEFEFRNSPEGGLRALAAREFELAMGGDDRAAALLFMRVRSDPSGPHATIDFDEVSNDGLQRIVRLRPGGRRSA
jgi:hypothetical protein